MREGNKSEDILRISQQYPREQKKKERTKEKTYTHIRAATRADLVGLRVNPSQT